MPRPGSPEKIRAHGCAKSCVITADKGCQVAARVGHGSHHKFHREARRTGLQALTPHRLGVKRDRERGTEGAVVEMGQHRIESPIARHGGAEALGNECVGDGAQLSCRGSHGIIATETPSSLSALASSSVASPWILRASVSP